MKTLQVPRQNLSQLETVFDKIKMLHEAGAEALIDQVNWKEDFSKTLPVIVRVAHDGGEMLYLFLYGNG